jgi:signal transduction histidine kinase
MRYRRNLRFRVAVAFAAFGAVITIVLATVLSLSTHDLSQRLIDETLTAELDDYLARRERNPHSLPPVTVTLHGYVQVADDAHDIPVFLRPLAPGRHDVKVGESSYRVAVADRHGDRFFLLYDTSLQQRREQRFAILLAIVVVAVAALSAAVGIVLSGSVIAPVAELAARVRTRGPQDWASAVADDFPNDEVGELARVFDRYVTRMRAFIERERASNADLSHELRTSLAVILSAAEMLLGDDVLPDKQKKRVARIDRAARDMSELGTALLLMAREETLPGDMGGCRVAEVVEEAVEKHRHLLGTRNVRIELRAESDIEVSADRGLVYIAVANLVRNAFAYTEAGEIAVVLEGNTLAIADTGHGVRPQDLDQVFLRHFRDAASEGAGIGLSLVRRICDRYGWRVRLERRPDRGTRASIEFS